MNQNIKININHIMVNFFFFLVGLLPFISLISALIPYGGLLKDIVCIFICFFAVIKGKLNIKLSYIGAIIYILMVTISLLFTSLVGLSTKIDMFRYRCEYVLTLLFLFSSVKISSSSLQKFSKNILLILYFTGVLVAVVGVIEYFEPSIIHSLYGSSITSHLSLKIGGSISGRLMSTMANPINLGLQMGIASVSVLYLLYDSPKSKGKGFFKTSVLYLSLLLFIGIAVFTYSRTAYVTFAGIIFMYYVIRIFAERTTLLKKIVPLIFIVLLVVVVIIAIERIPSLVARIGTIDTDSFFSNIRFLRAISAFNNSDGSICNSILGYGVGSFAGNSGQIVFEFGYASLLYESGIVGVLIYIFYISRCLGITLNSVLNRREGYRFCIVFWCIIVGFCIAMLTSDVYAQLPFSVFFWLSVFVIEGYRKLV